MGDERPADSEHPATGTGSQPARDARRRGAAGVSEVVKGDVSNARRKKEPPAYFRKLTAPVKGNKMVLVQSVTTSPYIVSHGGILSRDILEEIKKIRGEFRHFRISLCGRLVREVRLSFTAHETSEKTALDTIAANRLPLWSSV